MSLLHGLFVAAFVILAFLATSQVGSPAADTEENVTLEADFELELEDEQEDKDEDGQSALGALANLGSGSEDLRGLSCDGPLRSGQPREIFRPPIV